MRMRILVFALVIISFVLSGCAKSTSTITCSYDPCSYVAPASEVTQLETYLASANITTATKHCSGMYYQITNAGSVTATTPCSYITVNYKGVLTNGTVFDQSASGTPSVLSLATLIESWKKGIPLIKKGGSITLYVPPSLGYGPNNQTDANGNVIIPGNSILIFNIQLTDIQ